MKYFILPVMILWMSFSSAAFAFKADAFKGYYNVLSKSASQLSSNADEKQYMFIDVDTLGNIWEKYAGGKPLPADLEKYREEPTILVAFTDRETIFLSFESNAMITPNYLAVEGTGTNFMELGRRPDGNFNMGIKDKNVVSRYLLAPPTEHPTIQTHFSKISGQELFK